MSNRMSTGGGFRRGRRIDPQSRPAWVQLALRVADSGQDVEDYRSVMEDIHNRRGHPYRDIRYRNLFLRDRALYNQLRQEQTRRDAAVEETLRRRLPPELVRVIQEYRRADEDKYIQRITNRRE